ncbi:hypothetical protein M0R36_10545 [bacterium]|jgi:hypothetical protein|nr:hypothetical protein [bacterium]
MTQSIPLINKNDGFETVRDAIASILATETAAQQVLAAAAGQDPDDYKFRVFAERAAPWEIFGSDDVTPIVNVWFDGSNYDPSTSNVSTRQKGTSRFNIDVYSRAVSTETEGGHSPGDEAAAKAAHNAAKLVRNILMHDKYKYLGLQGTVWRRWLTSLTTFQPGAGTLPVENVVAVRLALEVDHNETIDLEDHEILEIVNVKMYHDSVDGQLIAELQFGEEDEGE